jgi:hypothetical protein
MPHLMGGSQQAQVATRHLHDNNMAQQHNMRYRSYDSSAAFAAAPAVKVNGSSQTTQCTGANALLLADA